MKGYDQRPVNPDNWLTHLNEGESEEQRQFVKVIHLPIGEAWEEVTDEYYQEWEDEHKPKPEPEPEQEDVEPVNEE